MKRLLLFLPLLGLAGLLSAQNIVRGEYFFDSDPGYGNGTSLTIGTPGTNITENPTISLTGLSPGIHRLYFRFKDATGRWTFTEGRDVYIHAPAASAGNILSGEYFFNQDPGFGNGISFTMANPSLDVNESKVIDATGLPAGFHNLNFRFRDNHGIWSATESRQLYIFSPAINESNISHGEYFFNQDPGYGNGTAIITGDPTANLTLPLSIDLSNLPTGENYLQVRFRNAAGKWSQTESKLLYAYSLPPSKPKIVAGEFFFNADPGPGKGTALTSFSTSDSVLIIDTIPLGGMSAKSQQYINLRFKNENGTWGTTESQVVYIGDDREKYFTPIDKIEYFFDNDPGFKKGKVDSFAFVMDKAFRTSLLPLSPFNLAEGRHFLYARAIDIFGQARSFPPNYKIVAATDTSKGMLLASAIGADSNLISSGFLKVYHFEGGEPVLYDSSALDIIGNFVLGGIPVGNYLLLLVPDKNFYPLAVNTYYDQVGQWEQGSQLAISKQLPYQDILFRVLQTEALAGTGTLSGVISTDLKKSTGIRMRMNQITGRPVKGASVVLVGRNKEGGNIVATTLTNENGEYSFINIPPGNYDVLVDILGVPLVNYHSVEVKVSNTQISNLDYVVGISGIAVPTEISHPSVNELILYPNPSRGDIYLLQKEVSEGPITLDLYDLSGRKIYSRKFEQPERLLNVNLSHLPSGIYQAVILRNNQPIVRKIILDNP